YISPEIFEEEFERVFARQWLLVGHASQIPAVGSYFTFDIAGESFIVVRGEGEAVHAHYNVCRHRGSRICDAASGGVTSFVCPYHAWSYAPDGRLESAPTIPDGEYIDYREHGLKSVRAGTCRGFIFIHIGSDEPSSLEDAFAEMSDGLPAIEPD